MKQLALDVRLDATPRFDNFFTGDNAALLAALQVAARGESMSHVYLWGAPGSGRTHLLRATCAAAPTARYLAAADIPAAPCGTAALVAFDDVHRLDDTASIAVFNAFNHARDARQTLVLAGDAPPGALTLREDLRSRIAQCLAFEIHPLTDIARSAILSTLAAQRGLRLDGDVVSYLMRYGRRDMPSLLRTLDALDRASLEHQRAITLPLLRELMRGGLNL